MAERLVIIACRNLPASISQVQAVPLDGGWGSGVLWGDKRVWGVWRSKVTPEARAALETLRTAGVIRVQVWRDEDEAAGESLVQFKQRSRAAIGPAI